MNENRLKNIVKEYRDSHNREFAPKTAYDEKQAYANKCLGQLVEEIERIESDVNNTIKIAEIRGELKEIRNNVENNNSLASVFLGNAIEQLKYAVNSYYGKTGEKND